MKKIVFVVLALFVAGTGYTQIRFGAKAGVNILDYVDKADGKKLDIYKSKVGFHFGGVVEIPVAEMFAVQPELLFVNSSVKMEGSGISVGTVTVNRIQVPVNAKLKYGVDNLKLIVTAGPYIGFGVGGKTKIGDLSTDIYGDNSNMKRFDAGLGAGIGVEVGKFAFNIGYQLGLANLTDVKDKTLKMNAALFSIGYFLK